MLAQTDQLPYCMLEQIDLLNPHGRTKFEVISFQSEELPAAMKKFFKIHDVEKGMGGDDSPRLMRRESGQLCPIS